MDKEKSPGIYKWIKIAGFLSFIPFVLIAGPLAGYVLGGYLEKRFGAPSYITAAAMAAGLIGSAWETVRIIKAALGAEKEG